MAENVLNTRIKQKGGSYKLWTEQNPVLLENEIGIVRITAEDNAVVTTPGIYLKVGNGVDHFNDLPFILAVAGDVYSWAKAENKPVYDATEITGIDSYIADYVNEQMGITVDTDTQYQIVKVDEYNYKLQSKGKTDSAWADVPNSTIVIPQFESEFEGLREELIGAASDSGDAETIHGVKNYTDAQVAKLTEAIAKKVSSIAAADGSIVVTGTATDPTFAIAIDETEGNALTLVEGKGLRVEVPEVEVPEYIIVKAETPTVGMASTYELQKDGVAVGAKIDIPKDYLVKSANIKTSTGENDPSGFEAGVKYIDFVINSVEGLGNESHIYLNVNDLVDVYKPSDGLRISEDNVIELVLDESTGLSTYNGKLHIKPATATTPGSMSAADKAKMDALHKIATSGNVIDLVQTEGDVLILDCGDATL